MVSFASEVINLKIPPESQYISKVQADGLQTHATAAAAEHKQKEPGTRYPDYDICLWNINSKRSENV